MHLDFSTKILSKIWKIYAPAIMVIFTRTFSTKRLPWFYQFHVFMISPVLVSQLYGFLILRSHEHQELLQRTVYV